MYANNFVLQGSRTKQFGYLLWFWKLGNWFYLQGGYSGSFKQKSLNIYGLNYWHEIGRNLYFETGMQLIQCHYLSTNVPPNSIQTNNVRNMISVPFKLRFEAGDFIFFNGGLTADLSKVKQDR